VNLSRSCFLMLCMAGLAAPASAQDSYSLKQAILKKAREEAAERESKRIPDPAKLAAEEELERQALDLASDPAPSSWARLVEMLSDDAFLKSLDSESRHAAQTQLRTRRIVAAIAATDATEARKALVYLQLGKNHWYSRNPRRVDWLIEASAGIKRPSPRLLEYLNGLLEKSNSAGLVVRTLLAMGTPESVALVEKRIYAQHERVGDSDPNWDLSDVDAMAYHRNHPAVVAAARRIVASPDLAPAFANAVVIAMFDDNPWAEMHCVGRVPKPPKRRFASTEVLREILAIGDLAEKRPGFDRIAGFSLDMGRPRIQAELAARTRNAAYPWKASRTLLETSRDSAAVERVLCELGRGGDETSLDFILEFLTDADFLARFDEARMAKVLSALTSSGSDEARRAVIQLAADPNFKAQRGRLAALLAAARSLPDLPEYPDGRCDRNWELRESLTTIRNLLAPTEAAPRPPS
jgi:hypothetical protein